MAGNVRHNDLVSVDRTAPLFAALRDPRLLGGRCDQCECRDACGGSRARAFAVTGDPVAAFRAQGEAMTVSVKREDAGAAPLARLLAWVVFALMVAAAGYAAWIVLANFNRIGV